MTGDPVSPRVRLSENQGLGYLLIHTLVEQIGGSLETFNDQGAVVRIVF